MNRIHEDPLVQCLRIFMVIEAQHLPCCCFDQDGVGFLSECGISGLSPRPPWDPLRRCWPRIANPMDLVQDWEAWATCNSGLLKKTQELPNLNCTWDAWVKGSKS